ncbi:MAG: hypothetical protein OR995_06530, partial [Candidatus Nanopelagicales bacterium]|nr:hypothetical protein [Candidatus Nanopelagicales bacterium]
LAENIESHNCLISHSLGWPTRSDDGARGGRFVGGCSLTLVHRQVKTAVVDDEFPAVAHHNRVFTVVGL